MLTDAQLLLAYCADRDAEAFAELVRRYSAMVFRTCLRCCREAATAEDATQECFVELARHANRVGASVPGWLHRVAVRTATRLRRRALLPTGTLDPDDLPAADGSRARAVADRVDEALAALPRELAGVVVMHFIDGRTQQEIADALGVSQPTIQRRLRDGTERLRRLIAGGGAMEVIAALPRPPVPEIVARQLGKLAVAGVAPASASATSIVAGAVAAIVLAVGACWWAWPRAASARPQPVTRAVVAAAAPTAESAVADAPSPIASPLDAPIALRVDGWQLDEALDAVRDALARAEIAVEVLQPFDLDADAPVTLAPPARPLRAVLDDIARQAGARWRLDEGAVLFDRARDDAAALVDAVRRAPDEPSARDAMRALLQAGDVAAVRDGVALLAGDAPRDRGIVSALRGYLPLRVPFEDHPPFLVDDAVRAALAARWSAIADDRVTSFDCWLVGAARVAPAVPRLRDLLADPARSHPALADDPPPFLAREGLRATAAWALARLGDAASAAAIGAYAADRDHPLFDAPGLEALRALRDEASQASVATACRPRGDEDGPRIAFDVYLTAMARDRSLLSPAGAAAAAVPTPPWAWALRPVPEAFTTILDACGRGGDDSLPLALVSGCARLPTSRLRALLDATARDGRDAATRVALRCADAIAGSADAWDDALRAFLAADRAPVSAEVLAVALTVMPDRGSTAALIDAARADGVWNERVVSILAHAGDAAGDRLLVERFADLPPAVRPAVARGLVGSVRDDARALRRRLLGDDAIPAWDVVGPTRREFDDAIAALPSLPSARRAAVFLALRSQCGRTSTRLPALLSALEAQSDPAFLRDALVGFHPPYKWQGSGPLEHDDRLVAILIRCAQSGDRDVRLAALRSMVPWAHVNGPAKLRLVRFARGVAAGDDAEAAKIARDALQNYAIWYIGASQSPNAWEANLRGESDDVATLEAIHRAIAGEDEEPKAAVAPAKGDADF